MNPETNTEGSSLRIAMVAACPFPSPRGSQVLIRELAYALGRRGHEVHVVTYPYGESLLPLQGMFVHRLRRSRLAAEPGLGWRRLMLDAALALLLYRVVRRERIQVIHAHNYEGPLIAYLVRWFTGVPVVYHSHNALSDELAYYFRPGWRRSVARWFGRVLDRQIPRRADFSIALTPELHDFLRTCGVAADHVAVIPPGTTPLTNTPQPATSDDFAGRFVVMYAGNLDPYQDLEVLFSGFAAFQEGAPRAVLVVVTHEANWGDRDIIGLKMLVNDRRARVIVAPTFGGVRRLLARADVLVCPRSSWSGFPIKLLNYLAAGRPLVVATGSAKGIVNEHTGLVFRDGDAQGLAVALRRLWLDTRLRLRLGENARSTARRALDWDQTASQVDDVYGHVCSRMLSSRGSGTSPAPNRRTVVARGLIALSRGRISAAASGARRG